MMILDKKGLGAVKKQTSLRVALLQMVLIPALGVIIILVGVFIISAYITQSQIIQGQQNLINILAQQSNQYLIETRQLLITLASSMLDLDSKIQQKLLSQARANYPRFTAIYLLDNTGRVIAESTESLSLMNLDMTGEAFYRHAQSSKDVFFSDPFISPSTGHVSVTGVIPIYAEDQFNGVLVGELNLDSLQQVIEPIKSGEGSSVFIVDQRGTLIAHPIAEWVQQQRDVGNLPLVQDGLAGETNVFKVFYDNDQKAWLIGSLTPMPNNWLVVITQPAIIAARPLIGLITISGLVLLLTLVIFVITQTYSLRRITQPISALVEKANRLAGGDYKILSDPQQSSGFKEITSLEQSFTRMVEAVQERDHQLEQRVIERTQRLELIATLGEQLSAILDLDKLLTTMVNQVQQNFGYYHVHIYLLDDKNENLVVIEGTGNAGAEMKARGHHIALNTPTSLVAQAARNKQIVWVDNVRESPDWLPNPLLPDTQTEMAVPIIIEGKVVGVLDVQGDEVAGLDEADAGLLRSLANQVAVAIRNSRLFAQVETALAEIRATQERYLSQVWQKSQAVSLTPQHLYTQPGA
ncbi:MAG TPA: cache domain-containing protein, partial [Anaerolineae bacterium]|nr:cache domain-containing protein [Anaerolineae bacterium]